jgi:hypothetical protein
MQILTSFPATAVSREQLNGMLADHLALEQMQIFRRLLVTRFGALALADLLVDFVVPSMSPYARWIPLALFLLPPLWAWIAELRLEQRLSQRLDGVDDATVHAISVREQFQLLDL